MSIDKNRNLTVQKLKLPETLRKSVRVLSQRQMISKYIRSSILIMRMEISVRYPIRQPKMESSHYLIFMMKEIEGELHSKGQTTEKVLRSYTYDVYGKVKEIKDYRNRYAKKNGRSGKV